MITDNDEQIVKNSIQILNENLPKIIHKAEQQNYKELIDPANNLLTILESINENYQTI